MGMMSSVPRGGWLLILFTTTIAAQDGCKKPAFIEQSSGAIMTPYYELFPDFTYPARQRCRWTITVPGAKNLLLTFGESFGIESAGPCPYDRVSVYGAERSVSPDICAKEDTVQHGPFCGSFAPDPIVAAGNTTVIEFCSDISSEYQGFKLYFTATEADPTPIGATTTTTPPTATPHSGAGCGETTAVALSASNGFKGILQSPNYPEAYPSSANCRWTVTAPSAIEVNAVHFQVDRPYDFLEIRDLTTDRNLGTFSGTSGPRGLVSDGGALEVTFQSNGFWQGTGFRLEFSLARCPASAFPCPKSPNASICLTADMICDGNRDCPNGEDEYCPNDCGRAVHDPYRIVGGLEARPHSWPWQIRMFRTEDDRHFCGGSIIDRNWIMTAGHCCDMTPEPDAYYVRVGEHDVNGGTEPNVKDYYLSHLVMHPQYSDNPTLTYDFCLLKTKQPILFNDDVLPVCLPAAVDPPAGITCYVTGWGSTSPNRRTDSRQGAREDSKAANVLKQVDVKIIDQNYCNAQYEGVITRDVICAANPGKDSCQGDSGGPLVCKSSSDADQWELTGVVSWGRGCARPEFPGIYARNSHVLKWITTTVMGH